jgi:hypothetical protein
MELVNEPWKGGFRLLDSDSMREKEWVKIIKRLLDVCYM